MSLLRLIKAQLGLSSTPANNFTLTAEADNGTMKLARGNAGSTTQDIMTVDASGRAAFPLSGLFCRAMVVFNGIASAALSYTRSGTTVTVTHSGHGYSSGAIAEITSATDSGLNSPGKVITVVDANTYTFQTSATGANGTLVVRSMIRSQFNVASIVTNGTADYTINFANPMPDRNYCFMSGGGGNAVGPGGGWGFTARDYASVLVNSIRGAWGTTNVNYQSDYCGITVFSAS